MNPNTTKPTFLTWPYLADDTQFSLSTSNLADAGTYTILILGIVLYAGMEVTFTVTVVDPCLTAVITTYAISSIKYEIA